MKEKIKIYLRNIMNKIFLVIEDGCHCGCDDKNYRNYKAFHREIDAEKYVKDQKDVEEYYRTECIYNVKHIHTCHYTTINIPIEWDWMNRF